MKTHPLRTASGLLALGLLSACAPMPPHMADRGVTDAQIQADRTAVQAEVPPLGARLTLDEAIARALKFNLDRRARMLEEAFALRQFEETGFDRLPKVLAAAGYTHRSEDRTARSIDSVTGLPSLANPSISSAREHVLSSVTVSWSLLDFGLSHYSQMQAEDKLLAAAERRRKATHLLVQEVRTAYFRAASAQRLRGEVSATLALADEAMADSRRSEQEKLRSPLDSLRYQRQLTENMRLLESIEQELSTARFDLAALINVPVMQQVTLAMDEEPMPQDLSGQPAAEQELLALSQNADLREHRHLLRIAQAEAHKVIHRAYPNLTLSLGANHDSDSYLVNPGWMEAGAQFSFNLLNLLTLPAQRRTAQAAIDLAEQRRLAAHVALVAQVHVAREQLQNARRQFDRAEALWQLDTSILAQTQKREQAQAGSKLDRVAAQTTAIISQLRRYQALAHWHACASRMQATLGSDPLPQSADSLDLDTLSRHIRQQLLAPPARS